MSEVSECTKVLLFALPRDLAGSDQVQVMLMPPFTAGELKLALAQKYPVLTDCLAACRLVADNRYLGRSSDGAYPGRSGADTAGQWRLM